MKDFSRYDDSKLNDYTKLHILLEDEEDPYLRQLAINNDVNQSKWVNLIKNENFILIRSHLSLNFRRTILTDTSLTILQGTDEKTLRRP